MTEPRYNLTVVSSYDGAGALEHTAKICPSNPAKAKAKGACLTVNYAQLGSYEKVTDVAGLDVDRSFYTLYPLTDAELKGGRDLYAGATAAEIRKRLEEIRQGRDAEQERLQKLAELGRSLTGEDVDLCQQMTQTLFQHPEKIGQGNMTELELNGLAVSAGFFLGATIFDPARLKITYTRDDRNVSCAHAVPVR